MKARYVLNLAQAVHDGAVPLDEVHAWDDEAIIAALTAIKGVGAWTAEMFLIFALGRPDVLSAGDLGIRVGLRTFHGLDELPEPARVPRADRAWRPYRTVAMWYLWEQIDNPEEKRSGRGKESVDDRSSSDSNPTLRMASRPMEFDLILKGGWVIDGTGGPAFLADVAVLNGMIFEVGHLGDSTAAKVLDATGLLHRPRVHRRPRPRRFDAPGRPHPPPGAPPGGDDLHHRPGRLLVRPGLGGDDRLHAAVHRRVQRQPARDRVRLEQASRSISPGSTARSRSTSPT